MNKQYLDYLRECQQHIKNYGGRCVQDYNPKDPHWRRCFLDGEDASTAVWLTIPW